MDTTNFDRNYVAQNPDIAYDESKIDIDALITIDGYQAHLWEIIGIVYNDMIGVSYET